MSTIAVYPKLWAAEILTYTDLNNQFNHIRNGVNASCLFIDVAGQTVSETVTFSAAQTFSAGITTTTLTATGLILTPASATGGAGLRLPHGTAPTSPTNGDIWTTTTGVFARVNGATQGPLSQNAGSGTAGKLTRWTAANTIADAGASDDGTYTSNATNPRARAINASVAVNSGGVILTYSSAPLNVGTMWAIGNAGRFTVPASAGGCYLLTLTAGVIHASSSATCAMTIKKNGSTDVTVGSNTTVTTTVSMLSASVVVEAAAADYYEWSIANSDTLTFQNVVATATKLW